MDCKNIEENLVAYLDGELSEEEFFQIKEHVSSCPHCSEEIFLLMKSWDLLKSYPEEELSDDFKDRLIKKIESRIAAPKVLRISYLKWIPLAAAAVFLIFALCWILFQDSNLTEKPAKIGEESESAKERIKKNEKDAKEGESETKDENKTKEMFAKLSKQEREIVKNLYILRNIETVKDMELIQNFEILENYDSMKKVVEEEEEIEVFGNENS